MSVLGAIATLAPSVLNVWSTQRTNRQNYQLTKETNKENLDFQREVMALNREQYLSDREYNSPSHLASMMEAAGFNKNLLTGINPESAVMSPNSASPSSVAPHNDAWQLDPNLIMNMLENQAKVDNIKADTENKKADTENKKFENTDEQRYLRTRLLEQTGNNMAGLARQNLTKADVDEALKELFIDSEEYRFNSEIAQNRSKVADIFYEAIQKYGNKIANFDYRYQYSNDPQDLPAPYSKDGSDVHFSEQCLSYIERRLKELEIEDKGYTNRIDSVDANVAERTESVSTASPYIRVFIDLVRMLSRRR